MSHNLRLIGPITQLLPFTGVALRGPLNDAELPVIHQAGLLIADGRITEVGAYDMLVAKAAHLDAELCKLTDDHVVLPGFVDVHTHICFAGSRARDYAMRNAGSSYLDIAAAGGGIWDTVKHTRAISEGELASLVVKRAERHFARGVTTIEVKSGYGLSTAEELKMLRAIRHADTASAADLVPTCLAAHMLPNDFDGDHASYLGMLERELLPVLMEESLCRRIDAFVEKSAFSPRQVEDFFRRAKMLGFDVTVHADQFTTGGTALATRVGAASADHLEASGETEIRLLAASGTAAVVLPGASIGLGMRFGPARKLLDAGASLVIASDWNPGSAPMGDLVCGASILQTFEKLSNAEVLSALTFRAAAALRLADRGVLAPGMLADFVVFRTDHFREILYHQGTMRPAAVWKNGVCKFSDHDI